MRGWHGEEERARCLRSKAQEPAHGAARSSRRSMRRQGVRDRRFHLRHILKRVLIQYVALNLSVLLRQDFGKGTPRGLQDRCAAAVVLLMLLCSDHESPFYRP